MMSDEADLSTYFIDIFQDPAGDEGRVAGRDTARDPACDAQFDGVGVHSAAACVANALPSFSPLLW